MIIELAGKRWRLLTHEFEFMRHVRHGQQSSLFSKIRTNQQDTNRSLPLHTACEQIR